MLSYLILPYIRQRLLPKLFKKRHELASTCPHDWWGGEVLGSGAGQAAEQEDCGGGTFKARICHLKRGRARREEKMDGSPPDILRTSESMAFLFQPQCRNDAGAGALWHTHLFALPLLQLTAGSCKT